MHKWIQPWVSYKMRQNEFQMWKWRSNTKYALFLLLFFAFCAIFCFFPYFLLFFTFFAIFCYFLLFLLFFVIFCYFSLFLLFHAVFSVLINEHVNWHRFSSQKKNSIKKFWEYREVRKSIEKSWWIEYLKETPINI